MAAPAHMIEAVEAAMKHIQAELRAELEAQGHRLTGALEESVQYRVFSRGSTVVVGEMSALSYGFAIELGVPASRIPYSGRSGRGGRSAYIQGLVRFFELRGLEPREALSAAFATATVHKREGMPTASSFGFSKNGRRTGFLSRTLTAALPEVTRIIEQKTGVILTLSLPAEIKLEAVKIAA